MNERLSRADDVQTETHVAESFPAEVSAHGASAAEAEGCSHGGMVTKCIRARIPELSHVRH